MDSRRPVLQENINLTLLSDPAQVTIHRTPIDQCILHSTPRIIINLQILIMNHHQVSHPDTHLINNPPGTLRPIVRSQWLIHHNLPIMPTLIPPLHPIAAVERRESINDPLHLLWTHNIDKGIYIFQINLVLNITKTLHTILQYHKDHLEHTTLDLV